MNNPYTVEGFVKATDKYTQGKIAALREMREMVREYQNPNPNAPRRLTYAEDYVCKGILFRIDALIKREEGNE